MDLQKFKETYTQIISESADNSELKNLVKSVVEDIQESECEDEDNMESSDNEEGSEEDEVDIEEGKCKTKKMNEAVSYKSTLADIITSVKFVPLTGVELTAWTGIETKNPLIGYSGDYVYIIDGNNVVVYENLDEESNPDSVAEFELVAK